MTELGEMLQAHKDRYGATQNEVARRMGAPKQMLTRWNQGIKDLPERRFLVAAADVMSQPYGEVLYRALVDAGYIEPHRQSIPARQLLSRAMHDLDRPSAA